MLRVFLLTSYLPEVSKSRWWVRFYEEQEYKVCYFQHYLLLVGVEMLLSKELMLSSPSQDSILRLLPLWILHPCTQVLWWPIIYATRLWQTRGTSKGLLKIRIMSRLLMGSISLNSISMLAFFQEFSESSSQQEKKPKLSWQSQKMKCWEVCSKVVS